MCRVRRVLAHYCYAWDRGEGSDKSERDKSKDEQRTRKCLVTTGPALTPPT